MTRLRYIGKRPEERGTASATAKITLGFGFCLDPIAAGFRATKRAHFHGPDQPCATVRRGRGDLIEFPDTTDGRRLARSLLRSGMGPRTRFQEIGP